jgi:hypothetical protein
VPWQRLQQPQQPSTQHQYLTDDGVAAACCYLAANCCIALHSLDIVTIHDAAVFALQSAT